MRITTLHKVSLMSWTSFIRIDRGEQKMKFIDKLEVECPYCGGQLQDETRDGKEVKVCYSEGCRLVADTGRVWECADYGYFGN